MAAPAFANPFGQFFSGLAAHAERVAQQASSAFEKLKESSERASREAKLPPRVVVLPRHAPLAMIIPGDSIAEQVLTNGLNNFLNLYNTALIVRLVLTWFPNPPNAIVSPLATVCDPYLNLFRGIIPPLGGSLDFSPILAFVVLNLFTNTAAALPAELPKAVQQQQAQQQAAVPPAARMSKNELAFQRRVVAQRSRDQQLSEGGDH